MQLGLKSQNFKISISLTQKKSPLVIVTLRLYFLSFDEDNEREYNEFEKQTTELNKSIFKRFVVLFCLNQDFQD